MLSFRLAAAHAERRYAVVMGANPGWSQDRPLRYAEQDADGVRDVLVSLGGFAPEDVALLRDPDSAEVRTELDRLANVVRTSTEDTLVFIYYSGHADERYLHLRGAPLSHRTLQELLRTLPATVTVGVIDACKSGAVTRKGGAASTEFSVDVTAPKLSGLVLLTSSGADELSQESRALSGSVFTHHLISGLRGAADADGDLKVTLAEAYHHAYELTRTDTATSGAMQRPGFRYELRGQGDLVLTRLATTGYARLKVPSGQPHRYVILDEHELRLIAEARTVADRDVTVVVAPGRYRIKHILDGKLEVTSLTLAPGAHIDLERQRYHPTRLSAGIMKGDPADLSPTEYHEWLRARALGVLADGNANAALNMFDRLVRDRPGDALAWRGRGRALVRMSESYRRVHDDARELQARAQALKSDPSLTSDPEFQARYLQLKRHDEAELDASIREAALLRSNPRHARQSGIGLDLFSVRGLIGLSATAVIHDVVFPRLTVDLAIYGADASVALALLKSSWSPYIGIGTRVSTDKLGITNELSTRGSSIYDNLYYFHVRIEGGMQFVGSSGFTTDLGLGLILFPTPDGRIAPGLWPVLHIGKLF